MKIKLVIISEDKDYVSAFSKVLSEEYADNFEISICGSLVQSKQMLVGKSYDVVLADQNFQENDLPTAKMYVILWDGRIAVGGSTKYVIIRKYQRISQIVSELMEKYAKVAPPIGGIHSENAQITAVWSPAGGVGKTTVAMAYAANQAVGGKQVIYLNFEYFSSADVYFPDQAKSISRLFEALNTNTNMEVLLTGIKKKDSASGIIYFGKPDNYDDINILTVADIDILLSVCAAQCDELVIDLPSSCEEKIRHILDNVDHVLAVLDSSAAGIMKWRQFKTQHNIYEKIAGKLTVVVNKGAIVNDMGDSPTISLPMIKSTDPVIVYKNLSACNFK